MHLDSDRPSTRRTYADMRKQSDQAVVRRWARQQGFDVSSMGGLPRFVYELYFHESSTSPNVEGQADE